MLALYPRQLRLPLRWPGTDPFALVPPRGTAGDGASAADGSLRTLCPPSTIRRRNPRLQGDIGMGAALGWFLSQGYRVALPLGESQPWDLIVEDHEGRVLRVQVKTTTHRSPYGRYVVTLATRGGNQSWNRVARKFDANVVELLFVLTDDGDRYLIPTHVIGACTALSLGPMSQYRLERG